jgi:glycosyltransferase involved in cell wall biosynthesis
MQVAGAEMLVAETIRRLGANLEPVVLCLDGVGALGERLRREGVPVVTLDRRPGFDLAVVHRLANEIGQRRLEVLHAHQYTPFFYSALARLRARRPLHVMFTEHGRHFPDVVSTRRRLVNRWILSRLADEITGVCEFSVRSLARIDGFGGRPIAVIDNGIDPERYDSCPDRQALKRRLGLEPARRYIGCVARFHSVKDHPTLVKAFAEVAAAHPDVDLLLAGDGPSRPDLEALAAGLGIGGRVRFLGVRQDVPELLQAIDIFAMTSLSEAASLTLLEAMAAGCSVVVTDVGGNPEIVRHGQDGLLVPRQDVKATSAALLALLGDPGRAALMGRSGHSRVRAHYRLDDTIRKYGERYTAATARLRARRHSQAD